jgi:hypothetical protein
MWLTISAVVLVVIVFWFFTRGGHYRKIFSNDQLLQFVTEVPRVKRSAVEKQYGEMPNSPDDPRCIRIGAIQFLYTISRDEGSPAFNHHLSVSDASGYTARATGNCYMMLALLTLEAPLDKIHFFVTASTVHHAIFELPESEHAAFIAKAVRVVSAAELPALREIAIQHRNWKQQ